MEGEKVFEVTLRLPNALRGSETSILDIPVDIPNNMLTPGSVPSPPQTPIFAPYNSFPPRLRLRDLVSPVGPDGRLDPQGPFERPGAAWIWRENGRRLIAVRFSIRGRGEADVLAEAREKLGPLFQAPYQAVWSCGAR
jgi:cobalt-zinc-cadmium resistance protein CzcA